MRKWTIYFWGLSRAARGVGNFTHHFWRFNSARFPSSCGTHHKPHLSFGLGDFVLPRRKTIVCCETLPLAGQWRFAPRPRRRGRESEVVRQNLPDKIQLPGASLKPKAYGDKISVTTPWVLSLYDHFWYLACGLRGLHKRQQCEGSVSLSAAATLSRRGVVSARRRNPQELEWQSASSSFLERPKWKSTVWLDDKEVGSDIRLCVTHEYDFGLIPPGKHRLTVRKRGQPDDSAVSPRRAQRLRIRSTKRGTASSEKWNCARQSPVWIQDVQVFPSAANKSVQIKVKIRNSTTKPGSGSLNVISWEKAKPGIAEFRRVISTKSKVTWETNVSIVELELKLDETTSNWDEFHPTLQVLNSNPMCGSFSELQHA